MDIIVNPTTGAIGDPTKRVVYTIGHDQITQATLTNWNSTTNNFQQSTTHYFGTDGHGSVRILYQLPSDDILSSFIAQVYHYDAYGNMLNNGAGTTNPAALLTRYLYSSEAFDFNIQLQYLRARFYDATTGRFPTIDPFFGNLTDPQSLHKYAYVHGDPIQGIDPSGLFGVTVSLSGMTISSSLRGTSGAGTAGAGTYASLALRLVEIGNTVVAAFQGYIAGGPLGAIAAVVGLNPAEMKEILQQFQSQGLTPSNLLSTFTSGAAGALKPIYIGLDVPERGKLGRVFKRLSTFVGRSNDVQEFIGEMGAGLMMHALGLSSANLPVFPSVKGPDFMARQGKSSVWAMVEAKGGTSRLSKGAQYGPQMQWRWINHWYHWLAERNQGYGAYVSNADGKDLWDHWGHGKDKKNFGNAKPIVAAVVSLNLNRPKDHLKIGVQAWTNNENAWNEWRSDF